ncbi:putative GPI-anchored protein pfl2, partial [Actinia tenebrosa]|uniref:GPI-anchored protein pfl2 n=1 Tax=Actinia tenebrosa TaxID=6105 RepID=A0A6P8HEL3_ACTTE
MMLALYAIVLLLQCSVAQTTGSEKNLEANANDNKVLTPNNSTTITSSVIEDSNVNRITANERRNITTQTVTPGTLLIISTPTKILQSLTLQHKGLTSATKNSTNVPIHPFSTNTTTMSTSTYNKTFISTSTLLNGTITPTPLFSSINAIMTTIMSSSTNTTLVPSSAYNKTFSTTARILNGTITSTPLFSSLNATMTTIMSSSTNTTTMPTSTYDKT